MSYRIELDEPVGDAVRRVAREQIGKAIDGIEGDDLDPRETVHDVRKRCKKIRALVRLVRKEFDGYREANRVLRDAARLVADLRDAESDVETLERVREARAPVLEDGVLAPVMRHLEARRDALYEQTYEPRVAQVHAELQRARRAVDDWDLDDDGFDAIAGGLHKTYRRGRARMDDAYDEWTVSAFHEWRKRVKYHRYHVRLLKQLWRGPMDATRSELHDLTDDIGDAHDCAELVEVLGAQSVDDAQPEAVRALEAFLWQQWRELNLRAQPLAERVFTEKPDDFVDRVGGLWSAAR